MEELLKLCYEKGIKVVIEKEEITRGVHITFSKDNKYFRRIIPYDDISISYLPNVFINQLVKEADAELTKLA